MRWIDSSIIHDEATIVDVWIIAFDSTELYPNIGKLMTWIMGHCPVGRRGNSYLTSIWGNVPIICRVQSLDAGRLRGDSINALQIGKAQHVVERPVFEH